MEHVSSWLQAAALPEWWNVCGVKCRPLTVWHVHVLSQIGNAYLRAEPADREAAAEMLLFASRNHADGARLFWQPRYRARAAFFVGVKIMRRGAWADIDRACMDYVSSSLRTPGHKEPQRPAGDAGSSRSVAAPLPWVLVADMSRGNPDAVEAAWDTPYSVARCLFDAARDAAGDDDTLETQDEEIRFDAYVRQPGAA